MNMAWRLGIYKQQQNNVAMFRYNIKIAVRSILRHKGFSVINIIGLSLGMACSLFMLLIAHDFYRVDTFHDKFDRIFLLQQKVMLEGRFYTADRVGGAIGPALKANFHQIEQFARTGIPNDMLLAHFSEKDPGSKPISFVEDKGLAVDSTFFDIFSFDLLHGDPQQALKGNNFIILNESLSKKFFGEDIALGKVIRLNDGMDLEVTGIIKDVGKNSSLQFTFLVPFNVMELLGWPIESYQGTNFSTYFLLNGKESAEDLNDQIDPYISRLYDEPLEVERFLTQIRRAYLFGESQNYLALYVFLIIGTGILVIACINYVNLTTAKSAERAKEVGIRKTGGAGRKELMWQFLGENFIMVLLAGHLALLILELIIPLLNNFSEWQMMISYTDPMTWLLLASMILVTGVLSGLYPAIFLSSMKAITILKEYNPSGKKGNLLRKSLVVFQFSMTLFFILCTIFLYRQFTFMKTADLGIVEEDVIYVPTRGEIWNKYSEIKAELLNESGIMTVSTASDLPTNINMGDINWGKTDEDVNNIARILWTSEGMPETFNLSLVSGKFYSENTPAENRDGIVVNEEVIRILGYEEDPIGQPFYLWEDRKTIIGVVKDYNFVPIDIGGKAMILPYRPVEKYIFIKTRPEFSAAQLGRIRNIFDTYNPNYPFEHFYYEDFEYPFLQQTDQLVVILFYLCMLGIVISCLGLFGLALYTTQKRTKEIGIRKSFGASPVAIVRMLSGQFIKLVLIACIIAIPLSMMVMRLITSVFTTKLPINVFFIASIAVGMIILSYLTILGQSIQAASQNPGTSLRYE